MRHRLFRGAFCATIILAISLVAPGSAGARGTTPLFGLGLVDSLDQTVSPQAGCTSSYVDTTCPGHT